MAHAQSHLIVDHLIAWHGDELQQSTAILLDGIPSEGGHVDRAILEALVREAFLGGLMAQLTNPCDT